MAKVLGLIPLFVTVAIAQAGATKSTTCKASSEVISEGQTAKITFIRDKHASDFTITKYPWSDDRSRMEEILFIRDVSDAKEAAKKYLKPPYDDVLYFVMEDRIDLLFTSFKKHHVGRYVGTVAKENGPMSCGLNVSMASTVRSTCDLVGFDRINCTFLDIPKHHTSRSFVVKRANDQGIEYYCDADDQHSPQCQPATPGSNWQSVPDTEEEENSFSAAFKVLDLPSVGSELLCELIAQPVQVERTCVTERIDSRLPKAYWIAAIFQIIATIYSLIIIPYFLSRQIKKDKYNEEVRLSRRSLRLLISAVVVSSVSGIITSICIFVS